MDPARPNLEVQVRPGYPSRGTDLADQVARLHSLADSSVGLLLVEVA